MFDLALGLMNTTRSPTVWTLNFQRTGYLSLGSTPKNHKKISFTFRISQEDIDDGTTKYILDTTGTHHTYMKIDSSTVLSFTDDLSVKCNGENIEDGKYSITEGNHHIEITANSNARFRYFATRNKYSAAEAFIGKIWNIKVDDMFFSILKSSKNKPFDTSIKSTAEPGTLSTHDFENESRWIPWVG